MDWMDCTGSVHAWKWQARFHAAVHLWIGCWPACLRCTVPACLKSSPGCSSPDRSPSPDNSRRRDDETTRPARFQSVRLPIPSPKILSDAQRFTHGRHVQSRTVHYSIRSSPRSPRTSHPLINSSSSPPVPAPTTTDNAPSTGSPPPSPHTVSGPLQTDPGDATPAPRPRPRPPTASRHRRSARRRETPHCIAFPSIPFAGGGDPTAAIVPDGNRLGADRRAPAFPCARLPGFP
jgi:hypothetical protein